MENQDFDGVGFWEAGDSEEENRREPAQSQVGGRKSTTAEELTQTALEPTAGLDERAATLQADCIAGSE